MDGLLFIRQGFSGTGCTGQSHSSNVIESWDVTNGAKPARLSTLEFGKVNETVFGSAFDVERKVAYAITARQTDPLYAISLADRANLKVSSAIEGLSGNMNVFRLIGDRKFLIGIGQDTSETCKGLQDGAGWFGTKVAVSIIDVQNLDNIRLVQRDCVTVQNVASVQSAINDNLDQAHKMLGMHSDGAVNVLTVPVSYQIQQQSAGWWWGHSETAVGMMSWDLAAYDPTKSATVQTVLKNHGTFIHPAGEVRRSILFTHKGPDATAAGTRMMVNLSDTHLSVANVQDLAKPALESVVELAPYYNAIYGFGSYIVEHVQQASGSFSGKAAYEGLSSFRVKRAGGDLDGAAVLATFEVPHVFQVVQQGSRLIVFRNVPPRQASVGVYEDAKREAVVYDLSNPLDPQKGGTVALPSSIGYPSYRYWCGVDAFYGGFWFDGGSNQWTLTDKGIVYFATETVGARLVGKIRILDVSDAKAPTLKEAEIPYADTWTFTGLVPDAVDPTGFFVTYRKRLGEVRRANQIIVQYKDYAERFAATGGTWASTGAVNLPGRLTRTWATAEGRRYLSQDARHVTVVDQGSTYHRSQTRLHLLKATGGATPAAELLGSHDFEKAGIADLVLADGRLFVNGQPLGAYNYGSGRKPSVGNAGGAAAGPAIPTSAGPTMRVTQPMTSEPWEDQSNRLFIFEVDGDGLKKTYEAPTKTFGVSFMGTHEGRLFMNLPNDGVLVVDATDAAKPTGLHFLRTLGHATHLQFAGSDAYVAAGHFGVYHLNLDAGGSIPLE